MSKAEIYPQETTKMPPLRPSCHSTYPLPTTIKSPANAWDGTSQLFLQPNHLENTESTIGAQSNLSENGQERKANIAYAL